MGRWRELNLRYHLTTFISLKIRAWTESLILEV